MEYKGWGFLVRRIEDQRSELDRLQRENEAVKADLAKLAKEKEQEIAALRGDVEAAEGQKQRFHDYAISVTKAQLLNLLNPKRRLEPIPYPFDDTLAPSPCA